MFENNLGTRVNAVKNQYVVLVVIYNLIDGKVQVDSDLQKLLELTKDFKPGHTSNA